MTRALMVGVLIAIVGFFGQTPGWAQQDATKAQAVLAKAMGGARISLQEGLAVGQREGTPISARFEVEEGTFQLSVFVIKGGKFWEVIVDHRSGKIATVTRLNESEDLAVAKVQREAMDKAKKSLRAALDAAVKAKPGYRAVSIIPAVKAGHPVAEVTLAKGDLFTKVWTSLD